MHLRRAIIGKTDAEIGELLTHLEKLDATLHEALLKESDRGLVLVAGAYFEDLLGRCLNGYFADCKEATDVLRHSSGLGTFMARLQCCRALRIIDRDEVKALKLLGEVRNKLAHNLEMDFKTQCIFNRCFALIGIFSNLSETELRKKTGPREAFLIASFTLANRLHRREINTFLHCIGRPNLLPDLLRVDQET